MKMKIIFLFLLITLFVNVMPCQAKTFSDNFNDGNADGWWLGYSQHAPWINGNWRVEDNTLVQDQAGDDFIALVKDIQSSNQTVTIQVKLNSPSGYGGVTLWFQNDNNYVNVLMYPAIEEVVVSERVDGAYSTNHYSFTASNNTWYELKIEANSVSGDLKVYINNSYLFTHHVATLNRNGKSGVNNGNAGGYFDNFTLVQKIGHKPTISANVFQITTDGSQQNHPLIWNKTIIWTDWRGTEGLDIWIYNLKTKKESVLISKPAHQRAYGIWNNFVIYRDESTNPPSMRVYNIKTRKDIEVGSGENVVGGAIFGKNALYVDGTAGGDIYLFNLITKKKRLLTNNVYNPKIWGNKIVWTVHLGSGYYGIKGYDLRKNELFDISSKNDGYQLAPDIFNNTVVWVDSSESKTRIMLKNLNKEEEVIIAEKDGLRLSNPTISNKYVGWVDNMGSGTHDIFVSNRRTNEIIRLSDFGEQQSSPTIPDIYQDKIVWMSWHTGNGDIYLGDLR